MENRGHQVWFLAVNRCVTASVALVSLVSLFSRCCTESSKSGDKDSSLGEALQGGSLGQSLLFAAFVTLGLGLLNLSRSDSQVAAFCMMSTTAVAAAQRVGQSSMLCVCIFLNFFLAFQQEISFQVFRNQLLANGLVDKLEVSNKNLVKVYMRSSAPSMDAEGSLRSGTGTDGSASSGAIKVQPGQAPSGYKYYFHIGSVDSFERKMEEAQEALGITLGEEVRPLLASLTLRNIA
jgi:FtsH Extracellular